MWIDHTEYEEYQKLQLSTVVRYQHNNTLYKYRLIIVIEKISKNIEDIIFFQYRTPLISTYGHIIVIRIQV